MICFTLFSSNISFRCAILVFIHYWQEATPKVLISKWTYRDALKNCSCTDCKCTEESMCEICTTGTCCCSPAPQIKQSTFFFNQVKKSYGFGYGLASLTTFCNILGRYSSKQGLGACCSAIEQGSKISLVSNLKNTFSYCWIGMKMVPRLYELPNLKHVIKTSIYILVTAESACILTAETVNLAFFRQAMWLSMPLGLFAAAFVVTAIESYKMTRTKR